MEFRVVQGDIAAQSADALVNAAGTSLQMGSGVAGALQRAAGRGLNEEAVAEGPVDLGAAAVTDAYDPETLSDVRFIAYGDEEFETVRTVVESVRSGE